MTDLQLDFDALRTARTRVDDALSTFESAGTVGGRPAGLTGEDRLAGRSATSRQLGLQPRQARREAPVPARRIDAIVDSMTEVDAELARQAQEAAPETQNDEREG
jgi:hypothetical protein